MDMCHKVYSGSYASLSLSQVLSILEPKIEKFKMLDSPREMFGLLKSTELIFWTNNETVAGVLFESLEGTGIFVVCSNHPPLGSNVIMAVYVKAFGEELGSGGRSAHARIMSRFGPEFEDFAGMVIVEVKDDKSRVGTGETF